MFALEQSLVVVRPILRPQRPPLNGVANDYDWLVVALTPAAC